jgi:hypothetical protein
MTWWDRCRAFLVRADRSFNLWVDRLPEWGLALLLPFIILVVVVEWFCWFRFLRRAAAVVAGALVVVYVHLIRSGAMTFSWGEALSGLERGCFEVIVLLYVVVLMITVQMAEGWLLEALWPSRGGKTTPERKSDSSSLWDREIDGASLPRNLDSSSQETG